MSNVITAFDEISNGTHRAEDLASALIPWLLRIPDSHIAQAHITCMEGIVGASDSEYHDPGDQDEDVQDAINLLQEYAAPYTVVGYHEGDGSCLGCWPVDPDEIDDIPRVSGLDELEPGYMGEALVVNERGNCTLYSVTGWTPETTELWAVV